MAVRKKETGGAASRACRSDVAYKPLPSDHTEACIAFGNMVGLVSIVQIDTVCSDSPHMDAVKALWRTESKWLGFLPNGAFDQAAREGRIALALEGNQFLGYVLYRLSQGRVMITHLAINSAGRLHGVARSLLRHLSQSYPMTSGIGLWCRRDFPANSYWPKVGFVALHETGGRSRERTPLTFWWQDHGHPGLFSQTTIAAGSESVVAAIDANVFFDLVDEPRPQGYESLALRDDWIQDEAQLCVTDEIFNDINRDPDDKRKRQRRAMLSEFRSVRPARATVETKRGTLRDLFPAVLDAQTTSDLEHVARTAAAELSYFITRDEGLLRLNPRIMEAVGVAVLTPTEFINRLDRLRREASYRPVRLAGGVLRIGLLISEEVLELSKVFGGSDPTAVRRELRSLLLQPSGFSCQVARAQTGDPLALVAHSTKQNSPVCDAVLFQVRAGTTAETVARYLLHRLILQAASHGQKLVRLGSV